MKTPAILAGTKGTRAFAHLQRRRKAIVTGTGAKIEIHNVLVPVDFSGASLEAIKFTLPLLKRFGANLHLVHVAAPDAPLAGLAAMPIVLSDGESAHRVRKHLKRAAKEVAPELQSTTIHALRGQPFEQICQVARDTNIDLIVIATRGNTGLKHLVLGSTAERVVRYSPCPVLVVRPTTRKKTTGRNGSAQTALSIKKILVPIDFSDCSMKGLAYAKALGEEFRAKLVLLHAVHLEYYVASDEYARYDLPLLMQQAEKDAKEQMRDLVKKTDWEGLKVETALEAGHPGQQICHRAEDRHADLIVTSTHGLTGLKHILIGSTAEYMVRHAPCPVLVVPGHERPVINSTKT